MFHSKISLKTIFGLFEISKKEQFVLAKREKIFWFLMNNSIELNDRFSKTYHQFLNFILELLLLKSKIT